MLNRFVLSLILFNVAVASCECVEAVFVVHKDCTISEISKKEIKKVFLGKKQSWQDGTKVALYLQDTSAVHPEIIRTYCKKSPSQYRAYWKKMVFSGKSGMPKSLKSDADVISEISKSKGAIGYITRGSFVSNDVVRELKVIN